MWVFGDTTIGRNRIWLATGAPPLPCYRRVRLEHIVGYGSAFGFGRASSTDEVACSIALAQRSSRVLALNAAV
jgi:hypothetical protein